MQKSKENIWFAITNKLQTRRFDEPYSGDENILYWVKKNYAPQDNLCWYDYEPFNSEMEPTQLIAGNFTCLKMYEILPTIEGNIPWFGFTITDRRCNNRRNEFMNTGEKGIIELIRYMRRLADFENWSDFDEAMKMVAGGGRGTSDRSKNL
jgi:hypothetical protein